MIARLSKSELRALLDQFEENYVDFPEFREDLIVDVYKVKEFASFSDTIDEERRREKTATLGDLEGLSGILGKFLGRHQDVRGKINEHALVEYFRKFGYNAEMASTDLDQKKIDVVASNGTKVIYAQAKLGAASLQEMRALVKSVSGLGSGDLPKVAAILASSFPRDSELVRLSLEKEFGVPLLCIQQYQLLNVASQYRRMLK